MPVHNALAIGRRGGWVVAHWRGDVDIANRTEVEESTLGAVDNTDSGVVVDLSAVTYLDSAGIHALMRVRAMLEERQQSLVLIVPRDAAVARVLQIGGVTRAIPTFHEIDAAQLS